MLKDTDEIVTAFATNCAGPGWANSPLVVIVRRGKKLVEEYIQPNDQTAALIALHGVSSSMHASMLGAVLQYREFAKKDKSRGNEIYELVNKYKKRR